MSTVTREEHLERRIADLKASDLQFADAANLKIARTRRVAGPIEIGHQGENVLHVLLARVAQRRLGEYRGASRQEGVGDGPQCGSDDDFLERVFGAVGGDRLRRGSQAQKPRQNSYPCSLRRY